MVDGFDSRQLSQFSRDLLRMINQQIPKETKKFLQKEGNKLKKVTKAKAKQKVKKDTGLYQKSVKRGKFYKFDGDSSIRVYSTAPHAHLIEKGHRIVGKDGSEHGFQPGEHVFEQSADDFQDEFVQDCEKFIDEMIDKGLR